MSRDQLAQPISDDLFAQFIAAARDLRLASGRPKVDPDPSPGDLSSTNEDEPHPDDRIFDLAITLRAVLSQAQLTKLLHDEDPDVRFAAATMLGCNDENLRVSAILSAQFGLSTNDVLAARKRARSVPPAAPRLDEITDDELFARLVDVCERKGLADRYLDWMSKTADRALCGRLIDESHAILDRVAARGLMERLRPLMDHKNPGLRLSAALRFRDIDNVKAVATLQDVQRTGCFKERDDARLNLMLWRQRIRFPEESIGR